MKPDLSQAAQAVMDAANSRNSYGPDDCLNESRWIAAATLRAAGSQFFTDWDATRCCVFLDAIADELEDVR